MLSLWLFNFVNESFINHFQLFIINYCFLAIFIFYKLMLFYCNSYVTFGL